MTSQLTRGRLEPCKDAVGGIKAVYLINYEELDVTYDLTDTDVITSLLKSDGLTGISVFKYDLKGNNSGLEQTIQSNRDNGTTSFQQVLNLTLKKMDLATNKEIKLMAYGRPIAIVHTNNGDALVCGLKNGMEVTGGTIVTGQARADLYGYTLQLTGDEDAPANFLDGATKDDPFAGLTTAPTITVGT